MATPLDERFSTALHTCARGWRLVLDRRLKDLGMSQASWMTVAMASKAEQPLSQTELARRVGVEDATMVLENCPFDKIARDHTDLVCGLNLEFVDGVANGLGCADLSVRLEPSAGRCCVSARREAPPASPEGS